MSVLSKPYFHSTPLAFTHLEKILWGKEGPICPHCGTIGNARRCSRTLHKEENRLIGWGEASGFPSIWQAIRSRLCGHAPKNPRQPKSAAREACGTVHAIAGALRSFSLDYCAGGAAWLVRLNAYRWAKGAALIPPIVIGIFGQLDARAEHADIINRFALKSENVLIANRTVEPCSVRIGHNRRFDLQRATKEKHLSQRDGLGVCWNNDWIASILVEGQQQISALATSRMFGIFDQFEECGRMWFRRIIDIEGGFCQQNMSFELRDNSRCLAEIFNRKIESQGELKWGQLGYRGVVRDGDFCKDVGATGRRGSLNCVGLPLDLVKLTLHGDNLLAAGFGLFEGSFSNLFAGPEQESGGYSQYDGEHSNHQGTESYDYLFVVVNALDKIVPAILYFLLGAGPIIGFFLIAFGRFWSGSILLGAWFLLIVALMFNLGGRH